MGMCREMWATVHSNGVGRILQNDRPHSCCPHGPQAAPPANLALHFNVIAAKATDLCCRDINVPPPTRTRSAVECWWRKCSKRLVLAWRSPVVACCKVVKLPPAQFGVANGGAKLHVDGAIQSTCRRRGGHGRAADRAFGGHDHHGAAGDRCGFAAAGAAVCATLHGGRVGKPAQQHGGRGGGPCSHAEHEQQLQLAGQTER